jgi:site-specific DNA-methyltransferase (adenine-specific)
MCSSEVAIVASVSLDFDRADLPNAPEPRAASARAGGRQLIIDGQLALQIPSQLPQLAIEPEWKDQQRLWGHSFHPMCSYLASFPAGLVHAFIARYTRPGDVVLDPFSGRGTTPLQACAEGRIGAGNDLNPFAHILTAAKVDPPTKADIKTRVASLRLAWAANAGEWNELADAIVADPGSTSILVPGPGSRPIVAPTGSGADSSGRSKARTGSIAIRPDSSVAAEVALAFHPRTLAQLLYLRAGLDPDDRTDRFILATMTGILHGKSASYLSAVMPNTFSMAPRYVRDFVARTGFHSPERDTFALLDDKLRRLYRQPLPATRGIALLGDARDAGVRFGESLRARGLPEKARLVVTSPPYLRVVKYGYYNWLRLWLLGYDASAIDDLLDDAHHHDAYLVFMREVLSGLRSALADDAVIALVIGDVEMDRGRPANGGIGLAESVWEFAAAPEGYRLAGIATDDVAAGRKMTKLWGDEAGQATKVDRILILSTSEAGRRRAINGATLPIDWDWPPRSPRIL